MATGFWLEAVIGSASWEGLCW